MKNIRRKYRYLGAVHDHIPPGWKPILYKYLADVDKLARHWWVPRFVMNLMYKVAYGNGMVVVKRRWAHKVFPKMFRKFVLITQIKEKFGRLCLYNTSEFPILDLSLAYEKLSDKTCEKCGVEDNPQDNTVTTGTLENGHWVMTLCNECRKELNNKEHYSLKA